MDNSIVIKESISENAIIPIVVSSNAAFVPYLSVMLQSMLVNADKSRIYDVIVLHKDISLDDEKKLKWQIKQFENVTIRFLNVSACFEKSAFFVDQHLTIETYYRLVIPDLLPEYAKILYLDADLIIEGDIARLFQTNIENKIIAAVKDIDIAGQINLNPEVADYIEKRLGLDSAFDYFQAGVIVFNLEELRKRITTSELLKFAQSYQWRCHDQDVLNAVAKGGIVYLPQVWNTLMDWKENEASRMAILKAAPSELFAEYTDARENPQIVHFAGYQKPWNVPQCDFAFYFWKYAKQTPYYELILNNLITKMVEQKTQEFCDKKIIELKKTIELEYEKKLEEIKQTYFSHNGSNKLRNQFGNLIDNLLPYHSRRREVVKSLFHKFFK